MDEITIPRNLTSCVSFRVSEEISETLAIKSQCKSYQGNKKYLVLNEYDLVYVTDCVFDSVIISELAAALSDIFIGRSR